MCVIERERERERKREREPCCESVTERVGNQCVCPRVEGLSSLPQDNTSYLITIYTKLMEVACVRTKREASALVDAVKLNRLISLEP